MHGVWLAARAGHLACDFCNPDEGVQWEYDIAPFTIPGDGIHIEYSREWTACDLCADLFDRGNIGALAERSVAVHIARGIPIEIEGPTGAAYARILRTAYERRRGPRKPCTGTR